MNMLTNSKTVRRRRGPLRFVADFFNSIWLGIALIALILIYGTLGSAIPGFRQIFELTEFQYFNHWVFFGFIVLFCITLIVATFRRIKFNLINAGVITVHTGLLLMCYGSIVYFGNKIEGDVWLGTPVVKVYSLDRFRTDRENALITQFPAIVGETWEQNIPMLGGRHRIEVLEVRHDGLDTAAYVKLKAQAGSAPEEMLELTLRGGREEFGHIAKFTERFALVLSGSPETTYFYDDTTPALIIPIGDDKRNWAHFELPALPYYHERFVEYASDDPIARTAIPVEDSDGQAVKSGRLNPIPLVERWQMPFGVIDKASALTEDWPITLEIDGYLPYAELQPRPLSGGDRVFPLARVEHRHDDHVHDAWLIAEAPERAMAEFHDGSRVEFRWVGSETALNPEWTRPIEGRHVLDVFVKDKNVRRSYDVTTGQVIAVDGTDYTLTIEELRPSWPLMTQGFQNARTPIALVIVKNGETEYQRSVMQRFPQLNQDRHPQSHPDAAKRGQKVDPARDLVDDNIEITYFDADSDHHLIAAGSNLSPMVVHTAPGGRRTVRKLDIGAPYAFDGGSVTLKEFFERPRFETVPVVVPKRNRRSLMDVRRQHSAIRLLLRSKNGDWHKHVWVPFSMYNTDNFLDREPPLVVDGIPGLGSVSFIYGRAMRALPTAMTLEQLKTDLYPGEQQASEWTSHFRYRDPQTGQVRKGKAYLNNTYTIGDWTFYQARASGDHKSWTILGVGNRLGVWTMLIGCTLISVGMVYAFGVKPVLIRRRREQFAAMAGRGA